MSFLITERGISSLITCLIDFWNAFWARTQEPLGDLNFTPANEQSDGTANCHSSSSGWSRCDSGTAIFTLNREEEPNFKNGWGGEHCTVPALVFGQWLIPLRLQTLSTFLETGHQCQSSRRKVQRNRKAADRKTFALKILYRSLPLCNWLGSTPTVKMGLYTELYTTGSVSKLWVFQCRIHYRPDTPASQESSAPSPPWRQIVTL